MARHRGDGCCGEQRGFQVAEKTEKFLINAFSATYVNGMIGLVLLTPQSQPAPSLTKSSRAGFMLWQNHEIGNWQNNRP